MSERLPRVTASEVIKVLEKAGFSFSRQSGSHKIYKNAKANELQFLFTQALFFIPKY